MESDPTRICEQLVGLGELEVLTVEDQSQNALLRIHIRTAAERPPCGSCGGALWSDGDRCVELVDLPLFGRPVRLVWHKCRWRCHKRECTAGTTTEQDQRIAPPRERLTTRAGR